MNIIKLSLANLRFRAISNFFNVTILALGIATILTLFQINSQLEKRFARDLQGIDLVVGAKGSPLQLILSSLFHIDAPTGNIEYDEAETLAKNPLIKSAIPLSLGDNYRGFRIVGTNQDYITHYKGTLLSGKFFADEMEVVVGSEVAKINHLKIGDKIIGSHGLVDSSDLHEDHPYKVVGILKESGSALDRLVLTNLESVWRIHEHEEEEEEHDEKHHEEHEDKEITALLISYKTPMAIVSLPRMINQETNMQAASPAFEVTRLIELFGFGSNGIKLFAIILIIISAIGFFVTLLNSLNDRSYDIALMRSLGASRKKIMSLILSEGLLLGIFGTIFGFIFSRAFTIFIQNWISSTKHLALKNSAFEIYEIYVICGALILSLLAALIPALLAYKTNVTKILSRG